MKNFIFLFFVSFILFSCNGPVPGGPGIPNQPSNYQLRDSSRTQQPTVPSRVENPLPNNGYSYKCKDCVEIILSTMKQIAENRYPSVITKTSTIWESLFSTERCPYNMAKALDIYCVNESQNLGKTLQVDFIQIDSLITGNVRNETNYLKD
jgi:hypothetical protein